jgi:DHA3 family macrolide efflux protein-like MFS transporter
MTERETVTPPRVQPEGEEAPRNWATSFFTIFIGQALSLVGSRVGGFALVWWLTRASGSATVLATASLVATLPQVVLGPVAGALVDRWSRKRVLFIADSLVAAFSAGLGLLAWTGRLQIWHIYVIMFVRSLGGIFHWAAMQASTTLMVPKSQLQRISGMNRSLQGVMSIITPPLGALLMEVLEIPAIMAIDVVTAAFAIGPLFFVHIPQPRRRPKASETHLVASLWTDIEEGVVYLWRWTGMFIILVMAAVLNGTVNPAFSLAPILVKDHFGGDATQLGWVNSAWGVGIVLGGLALSVWGGFKKKMMTSLVGLIGMGAGILLVAFAPASLFAMALVGMFVAGFMNPIVNGPFMAIIQDVVEPDIQGRVFTVVSSLAGAAAPIGMAIAGPIADRFGVQAWFLAGGLVTLLLGLGTGFIPAVMNLEEHRPANEGAPHDDASHGDVASKDDGAHDETRASQPEPASAKGAE